MIAEDLKQRIDQLNKDQRHEVSVYLTKVQLESDPEYWNTIRKRSADENPSSWINIDDV